MSLRLRALTVADEEQALAAQAELAADDFVFLLDATPGQPWPEYVDTAGGDPSAARSSRRAGCPPTLLVAEVDGEIVGRVSVRHELNGWLARLRRPHRVRRAAAYRRRGYATEILRQALQVARDAGVERALVTCDLGQRGLGRRDRALRRGLRGHRARERGHHPEAPLLDRRGLT